MLHPTTTIIDLASLLDASEGIPLSRMRLMHKTNDLLITARAKADPLQDTTTFGYYNVRNGDGLSLSMITEEDPIPEVVLSPRQAKGLSIIDEEPKLDGRPYGRAVSTHKIVQRSRQGGLLSGVDLRWKDRTERAWAHQETTLRKSQSLNALRGASPVMFPAGSPVSLSRGRQGGQQDRKQVRKMHSLGALSEDVFTDPDAPPLPERQKRRDSVVSPTARPIPGFMRGTMASSASRATPTTHQQQPRQSPNRQIRGRGGRGAGGPPAMGRKKK